MNERNPFTYHVITIGLTSVFLFTIYMPLKSFLLSKKRGKSSIMGLIGPIPIQLFVLLCFLFIINYYYGQMNSFADNEGIHWKTLLSKKMIPWNQVVALNLLSLRGGEKALLIQSKKNSFKIELPLVGNPQQLVKFAEKSTHLKAIDAKGLFM